MENIKADLDRYFKNNSRSLNPSVKEKIKIIGENAEEKIGSVIDLLRKSNTQICSINIGTPTLEDVFIKLTT